MNKAILIGRIALDLELKTNENNKKKLFFTLAIESKSQGKVKTDFIPVLLWDNLAENTAKYCAKGDKIMIEGYINIFKDKERKNMITVNGYNVEFLFTKNKQNTNNIDTSDIEQAIVWG